MTDDREICRLADEQLAGLNFVNKHYLAAPSFPDFLKFLLYVSSFILQLSAADNACGYVSFQL